MSIKVSTNQPISNSLLLLMLWGWPSLPWWCSWSWFHICPSVRQIFHYVATHSLLAYAGLYPAPVKPLLLLHHPDHLKVSNCNWPLDLYEQHRFKTVNRIFLVLSEYEQEKVKWQIFLAFRQQGILAVGVIYQPNQLAHYLHKQLYYYAVVPAI